MDNPIAEALVYGCALLIVILMCLHQRNGRDDRIPQVRWEMGGSDYVTIISHISLWCMVLSLVFAGLVDIVIWASHSKAPSVSDLVHYYLNVFPWVGWVVAGLVYHLLVDRPAPPT